MRIASHIISVLFHPMLMPTIGMFLIFQMGTHLSFMPLQAKQSILIVIFVTTAVLPVSILPLLYQFKIINSFRMETARERFIPILITAFFYYSGYILLKKMGAPAMLDKFIVSSLIAVLLASIISFFWKISIHALGIGGVTGIITALSLMYGIDVFPWLTLLLTASALTASARLYLGDHKPAQVYAGYFLGFLIVFGMVMF